MNIFTSDQQLEFAQAEVLAVDYSGYYKKNGYYTISCRLLNAMSDNDKVFATPLDYNVKKLPIVGEIVVLIAAASQYSTATNVGRSFYYINTVPVHKSYNHNALPTVSSKNSIFYKQQDSDAKGFATGRVIIKNNSEPSIDETFEEINQITPLQMFSGDVLIEGRYGNSIRFGSTLKSNHPFANAPAWSIGTSKTGDPITIISNGRKLTQNNRLSIESINDDNSSIWLTSGQQVFFAPSAFVSNLLRNNKLDTGFKNNFSGNQIFINSDRININSKKYEINLFSRGGVSISSDRIISIESNPKIELEATKIHLGVNATHPALLGDITFDLLTQLCENLINLCEELSREIHLTGVGPTDPPKNAPQYISIKSNIDKIKSELPKIKSNLVFLNKSALAKDEFDKESKEQFKENLRS
jgi:hypothetical protein